MPGFSFSGFLPEFFQGVGIPFGGISHSPGRIGGNFGIGLRLRIGLHLRRIVLGIALLRPAEERSDSLEE